jgi:phosphoglycerate kinase
LGDDSDGSSCSREESSAGEEAPDPGSAKLVPLGVSGIGFHTLDDFDVMGRRVLLRIDINSPVDEKTLRLVDGSKIRSSVTTLRELLDRGAKVAILAHQGRPGDYDYIPLNEHAAFLTQYLGRKVRYVDDLYGSYALRAIDGLNDGESMLLKNVRFFPEEQAKKSPEEHAQSDLVKTLATKFDLFVNDAFASSHRSHASLVGFTVVLPSAAGRLMEREVVTLTRVFQKPNRPSTFIFGGTKFVDALPVLEKLAARETVDSIIVAGLAGYAFLWLLGKGIGSRTERLASRDVTPEIQERARKLIANYGSKIHLPLDAAVDDEGSRKEYPLDEIPKDAAIFDVGEKTINEFCAVVSTSKTVFLSGPPGVFEKDEFSKGTERLFRAITGNEAFSVIGGGHSSAAANKFGVYEKISYVSTGGGALERLMLGKEMPVVEALKASAKRI